MTKIKFNKILRQKEIVTLLEYLGLCGEEPLAVTDSRDQILLGSEDAILSPGFPVKVADEILAWVYGSKNAEVLADILRLIAVQAHEKKALGIETLEKYKAITMLYGISEKIAASLNYKDVAGIIANEAKRMIKCDSASVMLYNKETGLLELTTVSGPEQLTHNLQLKPGEGIAGAIFSIGKAEIINNVREDERFIPGPNEIHSIICVPLTTVEERIGVINVSSKTPRHFNAADLSLMITLSSQGGVAIENARLFNNLEQKVMERTHELRLANQQLKQEIQERKETQKRLNNELAEAAQYVKKLLPSPINGGLVLADWRFIPSTSLGGDSFGYHWIDKDNFAIYLVDVSGHGVGAALLSISVINLLRSQSLPQTDFKRPSQVLSSLNDAFPMELHNNNFFTIWYGAYNKNTRDLNYACGGHPPALLLSQPSANPVELFTTNLVIGGMPETQFQENNYTIDPGSRLYVFSDGVFEITKPDGTMWEFRSFLDFVANQSGKENFLDHLIDHTLNLSGSKTFEDDFTIVELLFK